MNLVEACELMQKYAKCPKCGCKGKERDTTINEV